MAAFTGIARLRTATDEGDLTTRADRMWEIACEMLGRPIPGAEPLEVVQSELSDDPQNAPNLIDAVKSTIAYIDWSESEWGQLPVAQRLLRKKCRAALDEICPEALETSAGVPATIAVPDRVFTKAYAEFERSQQGNPNFAWFDHLRAALTEVWPASTQVASVSDILEAADEWLRERAPAERGDLSMKTAFKDGVRWAIEKRAETCQ
jgi:hypothetical protein